MKGLGIPIRASQMPGADLGTRVVGALTGGADNAAQRVALTQRVAENIGQPGVDRLDAAAITKAHQDLDAKFDAVAPNLRVAGNDADLIHDLSTIDSDATNELGLADPAKYKVVDGLLTRVQNEMAAASAAGGDIPGETFRAMTRYGSSLGAAMHSPDPNIRHYAGRISEALNDAMERATPAKDAKALAETNRQWKNMLIVQEVADPVTGTVDPSKLLRHVDRKYGTVDPAVAGEMGTLAQGADRFLIGEARRPGHEMSGRAKAVVGALGGPGLGMLGAMGYEHGSEILGHVVHNPLAVGAGVATLGGAYAAARLAAPAIRRGINPLIPPAALIRNWPNYQPGQEY
jgi:hypothetical protein